MTSPVLTTRFPARPARAWLGLLVAAAAALVPITLTTGLVHDALYLLVGAGTVVAVLVGVRVHRPAQALPWYLMATGIGLWTVADSIDSVITDVVGIDPAPSPADPVYLLGYLPMTAALLVLVRGRRPRRDPAGNLDSAIVTAALALLAWVLLVAPGTLGNKVWGPADLVAALYPAVDLVLVGGLARLLTTPGGRTRSFRLLVVAVLMMVTADVADAALSTDGPASTALLEALWLSSYAVWGASALHPSMVSLTEPPRVEPVTFSRWRMAAIGAAVLVPPAVLAIWTALGLTVDVWAIVVGSVLVVTLAVLRIKVSFDQIQAANADREAARMALAHQAAHDSLTGLPNRAQAMTMMRGALSRAQRSGAVIGLLFVDLDGFKQVNDTLGHAAGDEVLVTSGRRMQACVRTGDVVARLGGDEFVVLLEPVDEETSAVAVADRVVAALRQPITLDTGREVVIGASVGVAIAQDGVVDPDRLLHEADVAVYSAKVGGRDRVEVFDRRLREELERRDQLQQGLARAIAHGDLQLRHEPVVDLATQTVTGYEVGVVWPRPGEDELSRADLLPVAERSELVCDLDTWVLRESARQVTKVPLSSRPTVLSVPMSGRHLQRARVLQDVAGALADAGLPASHLVVVLDESELDDDPRLLAHLDELRALGVRVCIDGFGTREGPTDRWSQLPVDLVRIDPARLSTGPWSGSTLLRLTIETAHTFGWDVVAGGVTDRHQLEALTGIGCRYAQGPMPRRTIAALSTVA